MIPLKDKVVPTGWYFSTLTFRLFTSLNGFRFRLDLRLKPTKSDIMSTQSAYSVNGISISTRQAGTGPLALIFLHYWGGSSLTWQPIISDLASRHTRTPLRCIAVDQRGWGDSTKDAPSFTLDDMADDVVELVKKLGVKRYIVVGHSMGGKVAQLLASRKPQGLEGLALVAPSPPVPQPMPDEERLGILGAYGIQEAPRAMTKRLAHKQLPEEVEKRIEEDTLKGSKGAWEAWPGQNMLVDISAQVKEISVPSLVIAGGFDTVDSEESLRVRLLPFIKSAELKVVPGSGHLLPYEAPGEVVGLLVDFIGQF